MENNNIQLSDENKSEKQKFQESLKVSKTNSDAGEALEKYMDKIIISILKGEITAKQASVDTGYDRETIRRKINEFVFKNNLFIKEYIQYLNKSGRDYSGINFKGLIIQMMKLNISQSEMAIRSGIPPRTVSRELEKIGKSTQENDRILYEIAKRYSENKMKRIIMSTREIERLEEYLDQLFGEVPIIEEDAKSKEELEIERLTEFLTQVDKYQNEGMTIKDIAKKMQVGVSTIRRNRLRLEALKELRKVRMMDSDVSDNNEEPNGSEEKE